MPRVTVIIPTYNRADLVIEAIDSVLGQTYRDFEVIVVDDGSTDGTKEVLRKKYGEKIRYMYQENQGVPPRNVAIEASSSEYIAFLDSDDLWEADNLEKQVALLDSLPDKTAMVYCGLHVDEGGEEDLKTFKPEYRGDILEHLLLNDITFSPSRVLLRRKCLEKVGLFDESLARAQDTDLWLRIAKYYDVDLIPEPLVIKRHYDYNQMKNPELLGDIFVHFKKVFDDPECPGRIKRLRRKAYANRYLYVMRIYYAGNMPFKAWGCFIKALLLYPISIRWKHLRQFLLAPVRPLFAGSSKSRYGKIQPRGSAKARER